MFVLFMFDNKIGMEQNRRRTTLVELPQSTGYNLNLVQVNLINTGMRASYQKH